MENGFIFHDLRHTFATNARRVGVHKNVVIAIQGHLDGNDLNKRYDTVDESDLINAIDMVETFFQSVYQGGRQEVINEAYSASNNWY